MRTTHALAAALVCLGIALGSSPATSQSPPPPLLATPTLVRYEDPVGDTPGGIGPDIVAVTVSQRGPEAVDIAVEFASDPPLTFDLSAGWTDMLMIVGSTGPQGVVPLPADGVDADFATGLHGANLEESVEQGAPLNVDQQVLENAVAVAIAGATTTLTLTRASLGDPERILFVMWTTREGVADQGSSGGDTFPDGGSEGSWAHATWTFPRDE